jgi:PAS domain S-box-containing protein
MKRDIPNPDQFGDGAAGSGQSLRKRAEELLQRQPEELLTTPPEDIQDLIHELQVHQVELKMQNVELRHTQRELERARDRYVELYDRAPVGYLTLDQKSVILQANLTAAKMLHVERERLAERHLTDFITPEDQDTFYLHRRRLFETGERQTCELGMVREDGSPFWARVEATTATDSDGEPICRATLSDVTKRRELEEQLRQQERLAAVGQLAGGIAHDFNNILAAITLHAEMPLSRSDDLPPAVQRALATILEESRRAADLVDQILDFSRSAMMDLEPVDLVALVEERVTLLRRTIPENIRLTTEMTSRPCIVEADRTRIHQMLMNLALNARDAMPEGGELRITVACLTVGRDEAAGPAGLPDLPPGAWACLRISDTGTGMKEEAQEHLFEPFFSTKEVGEGTGLGLAQVYGIVKQHQGFIDVDTAPGRGTTFTILLPLVDGADEDDGLRDHVAHHPGEERPDGDEAPSPGGDQMILVVEDAEQLRRALRVGLESLGYHVLTAVDGRQALEMVSTHDIDIVLTDVVMPHMGGEALLRELRARSPGLRVIAMTGHVVDVEIEALRAAEFSAVLTKPFSVEELDHAVRAVLG